jgi:hypothetical protein
MAFMRAPHVLGGTERRLIEEFPLAPVRGLVPTILPRRLIADKLPQTFACAAWSRAAPPYRRNAPADLGKDEV